MSRRTGNNYSGPRWAFSDRPASPRGPMPTVTYDGNNYKVRGRKIEIPDLTAMTRTEALLWLCANTYPRGYSKAPSPLQGMGGAISLTVH